LAHQIAHEVRINWPGYNERLITTTLHPIGTTYPRTPGVYIFTAEAGDGRWLPIYVGECDDLHHRLTLMLRHHQQWRSIIHAGATHICSLHVRGGKAVRLAIETELRRTLEPPCNLQ
jgi:excinuclease UvrABC nuclease subunit